MHDPYSGGGGGGGPPKKSANDIYRDAELIAYILAFLATLVAGPLVADFTEPYMHELFTQLYSEELAGPLTTVWEIGMYALVWAVAKMFLIGMIISVLLGAYMRFGSMMPAVPAF